MDVDSYRVQLAQVEAALKHSPGDEELIKLKSDLEEIIKVSTELEEENGPTGGSNTEAVNSTANSGATAWAGFTVGEEVLALYHLDNLMYPGTIIKAVPGAETISVEFHGYKNVEEVRVESVQYPQQVAQQQAQQQQTSTTTTGDASTTSVTATGEGENREPRAAEDALRLAAREVNQKLALKDKRAKQAKYREDKKAKAVKRAEERKKDVDDWKKFNNSAKRGHSSFKGLKKKKASIFASPTTVNGRVGVVGSDRKMTVNVDGRKKHIFKESAMAEDD